MGQKNKPDTHRPHTSRLKRRRALDQARAKASLADHNAALSDKPFAQHTDASVCSFSLSLLPIPFKADDFEIVNSHGAEGGGGRLSGEV